MSLDYHLVDPLGDDEKEEQQSDMLDGARILYVSRLKYLLESLCKSNANGHQTTAPIIINS
jgi:hypothetical protein